MRSALRISLTKSNSCDEGVPARARPKRHPALCTALADCTDSYAQFTPEKNTLYFDPGITPGLDAVRGIFCASRTPKSVAAFRHHAVGSASTRPASTAARRFRVR